VARSRVLLTGIAAMGRHGANPGERDEPQDFVVDLDVTVEVSGDDLDRTIDYRALADLARDTVAETSFVLLESLAAAVASAVGNVPQVTSATARVHKPGAAEHMGLDDVAAEATVGP